MGKKKEVEIKTEAVEEMIPEEENAIDEEISLLQAEIDKLKRVLADTINRNKQYEIDRKYASSDLIKQLLVPMSYFEGALKLQSDDETFNNFLKGFEMIYNLIFDTLKNDGLQEIEANVDEHFDPRFHEVTELIETEAKEKDIILEIVQKGYIYKERVIKPVQVKVSTTVKNNEDNANKEE